MIQGVSLQETRLGAKRRPASFCQYHDVGGKHLLGCLAQFGTGDAGQLSVMPDQQATQPADASQPLCQWPGLPGGLKFSRQVQNPGEGITWIMGYGVAWLHACDHTG
jgi:hypothetical protein